MKRVLIDDYSDQLKKTKNNNHYSSKFHTIYDSDKNILYEGEMEDDKRHGIGVCHNIKLKTSNTNIVNYVTTKGIFINNQIKYGFIYDLNNFLIYHGSFKNNIPNGSGCLRIILKINNKDKYYYFKGNIKNFNPNGLGIICDSQNKKIHDVNFKENNICKIIKTYTENDDINNANILLSLSNYSK